MKKMIVIIGAVVILAGLAYYFTKGSASVPGIASLSEGKDQVFSGPLRMAFEQGIPLVCSWKGPEGTETTGRIKGQKYAGKLEKDGKESNIIMADSCMWVWGDDSSRGMKMCFDGDIWEGFGEDLPENVNCRPGVFGDDIFTPPQSVTFMDFDSAGQY